MSVRTHRILTPVSPKFRNSEVFFYLELIIIQAKFGIENNPERVDGTVEHICFLADVNRLYDNALGIYDLQLTLLIAQQSQKVSFR